MPYTYPVPSDMYPSNIYLVWSCVRQLPSFNLPNPHKNYNQYNTFPAINPRFPHLIYTIPCRLLLPPHENFAVQRVACDSFALERNAQHLFPFREMRILTECFLCYRKQKVSYNIKKEPALAQCHYIKMTLSLHRFFDSFSFPISN